MMVQDLEEQWQKYWEDQGRELPVTQAEGDFAIEEDGAQEESV